MKKLTIIIPCYNAEPYINELLDRLDKQITEDVEVIIVDDGSEKKFKTNYKWAKVIRQKNGGASVARNTGIDNASGEYIAFIDADDMVSEDYISKIFEKLKGNPDYLYLSWKSIGSWSTKVQLKSVNDEFPPYNLCVWNRVYKRSLIGDVRFNPKKLIAEDAEFIRKVQTKGKKKDFISDMVYYYRSNTPNSLTKRFRNGSLNTKRVVYYFNAVRADMTYLIDEFKKADEDGEVILMTNRNDIKELNDYAMVISPMDMIATEARGEKTDLIKIVEKPKKTQVIMWTRKTFNMGGLETFIYSFCREMCEYYDIVVLYDEMDFSQIKRLQPYVECRKNNLNVPIECDTIIVNRILESDKIPSNITYKHSIQMVHGIKHGDLHVPQDKETIVSVSQAVKDSFKEETKDSVVIKNMLTIDNKEALLLVSTSRLDTLDKGGRRMVRLAQLMNNQGINFVWLCFTNAPLPNDAPSNMIRLSPTTNILPIVAKADYLIQLSDHEAFCYSIVESLSVGTPVICTPLDVLPEIGCVEGKNCYVVPFELNNVDTKKFLKIPKFEYQFDNAESVERWRKVLGNTKPTHSYKYDDSKLTIEMTLPCFDTVENIKLKAGDIIERPKKRAMEIVEKGFAKILG